MPMALAFRPSKEKYEKAQQAAAEASASPTSTSQTSSSPSITLPIRTKPSSNMSSTQNKSNMHATSPAQDNSTSQSSSAAQNESTSHGTSTTQDPFIAAAAMVHPQVFPSETAVARLATHLREMQLKLDRSISRTDRTAEELMILHHEQVELKKEMASILNSLEPQAQAPATSASPSGHAADTSSFATIPCEGPGGVGRGAAATEPHEVPAAPDTARPS